MTKRIRRGRSGRGERGVIDAEVRTAVVRAGSSTIAWSGVPYGAHGSMLARHSRARRPDRRATGGERPAGNSHRVGAWSPSSRGQAAQPPRRVPVARSHRCTLSANTCPGRTQPSLGSYSLQTWALLIAVDSHPRSSRGPRPFTGEYGRTVTRRSTLHYENQDSRFDDPVATH